MEDSHLSQVLRIVGRSSAFVVDQTWIEFIVFLMALLLPKPSSDSSFTHRALYVATVTLVMLAVRDVTHAFAAANERDRLVRRIEQKRMKLQMLQKALEETDNQGTGS